MPQFRLSIERSRNALFSGPGPATRLTAKHRRPYPPAVAKRCALATATSAGVWPRTAGPAPRPIWTPGRSTEQMSFLDIVERSKAYLARHQRVSLRALRREFDLDDAAVEELVEELVEVQRVAVLDGKTLAWAVPTASPTPAAAPGTPGAPTAPLKEVATSAPVEAERRQLTVMFCDLSGSTTLGRQLDSEHYREIVRAYYDATRTVTDRWGGHVATYMGDGLLVYFGYPQARENDAERAVRAGLEIVEALSALNKAREAERSIRLAVRVGIHTGPVVVGELGRHGDNVALGDTMNRAARIEAAAEPDTVVCSGATRRLVAGLFVTRDLSARELGGIDEPMRLHQVVRPSGMRSRLEVAAASGLTPLVGRRQELGLLEDRWEQVTEGRGQAVLLCGDAGIGKSRLVQAFRERIADRAHTWLECRGSPYTQDSAFYPVLEAQRLRLGLTLEMAAAEKLARMEAGLAAAGFDLADAAPILARFHGFPIPEDRYRDPVLAPEGLRKKTLALLVEWLLRLGRQQPAVLLVEDLHWLDPSSLELLGQVIEQLPTERVLLLLTFRPDFAPPWWTRSHLTPMLLSRLTRAQLGELVRKAARGRDLPEAWVEGIVRRSDGVPLFAEELTRAVIETSPASSEGGATPDGRIPATLQDALMARLDALGRVKELAQVASVLGREFDYELLRAVALMADADLEAALATAVREDILYQRGAPPEATYVFRHALIQDAAYESMLRSTRRRHHGRVAEALGERLPHVAEPQPELLAHHLTEAGRIPPAVDTWHEAGRRSLQRSANKEALEHLKRALDLLATQPPSPERDREELDLQIDLGAALKGLQGWGSPEGERCYVRARELCLVVGDDRKLFPILWSFWNIHQARSELAEWREIAAQRLAIAERRRDPAMLVQAHHANWGNFAIGDFPSQLEHVERGLSHYDPTEHSRLAPQFGGHDAGICGHCHRGVALWATGYPARSAESFAAAQELADQLAHPLSKAHRFSMSTWLPVFRSDWPAAFGAADTGVTLMSEFGMPTWASIVKLVRGWARVALGDVADGLAEMRSSLIGSDAVGFATHHAFYAEALYMSGAADEALAAVDDALPMMERQGE